MKSVFHIAAAAALLSSTLFSAERVANGSFTSGKDGWNLYHASVDAAVSYDERGGSVRLDYAAGDKGQSIIHQVVLLDQKEPAAFAYSCMTKAAGLPEDAVPSHRTYGVELCVQYADGSSQWIAPSRKPGVGTHGWERLSGVFTSPRAVRKIVFYARLRLPGRVWFDQFSIDEFDPPRSDLKGCRIVESDDAVTLENDYVKLVFEPANGGTCREFRIKGRGANFAGKKHHEARMFADRLRVGGNCFKRVYKAETLKNSSDEAVLKLSVAGPEGHPFLVLSKTFRITGRSSSVECTYQYRNLPESMAPVVVEPYFRHGWSLRKNDAQRYFVPTAEGVKSIGPTGGNVYVTNAVAGWLASGDGKGSLLACEFDFSRLTSEYFWLGGVDDTTSEWTFMPVEIACGGVFETTQTLYPASGISNPDVAENGIVIGSDNDAEGNYMVRIASAANYILELETKVTLKNGKDVAVARTVQVSPDCTIEVPLGVKTRDVKAVRTVLYDSGRMVCEAERVLHPGFVYKPKSAKAKPAEMKPFELKLSEEVVTPHVKWMKPFAGGRPRVFFLVDILHQREVVELAQRMDLDHRVVRFSRHRDWLAWGMCDRYSRFTFEDANLAVKRELDRPLDAIVISGDLWRNVDAANRARIKALAASGVGVIEIGTDNVMPKGAVSDAAGLACVKDAVSKELLPYGAGSVKVCSAGKSRYVKFDYPARGGLTPFVPYDRPEPPFRYQDYSLGVMARAVAWASGKVCTVPPDAERRVESFVCADGLEITHEFFKDASGRVCDWKATARKTSKAPTFGMPDLPVLIPEDDPRSIPFAVGESGYRLGLRRYLVPHRFAQYRKAGVNELRFWHPDDKSGFFDDAMKMGFKFDFPVTDTRIRTFIKDFSEPYLKTGDKKYLCRKPCFHDENFTAADMAKIKGRIEKFAKYAPTSLDCGDENSLTKWGTPFDFCFSEKTLSAEREWLKGVYGSLKALNRSWGTSFAAWNDVVPLTTEEVRKKHSGDRRWAAWADHRRFMEITYCGYFKSVSEAIKARLPGTPLDMSGTQPPNGYTGMDMWLLSESIGVAAAYDVDNLAEIVRSFRRPLIKPWYGYGASGPNVERRVWYDALRFRNFGVSYFDGINILQPDYTLPKQVKELHSALRFFIDGGGALLRTLDEPPQALIHYSQASIHAAQIERRYDSFLAARATWCKLLDDMNVSYRFVAYAELESGELKRTPARVLILPESSALSDGELSAIRGFADKGGIVVGDRHTATHDIHCNFLGRSALHDLFASGKKGVCIDRILPQYCNLRMMESKVREAIEYRNGIASLFAGALPRRGVEFGSDGITGVRTFVLSPMKGGPERYLGFVREGENNGSSGLTHVRLSSPCRVRNMRTGQDMGVCRSFDVPLAPFQAAFYKAEPVSGDGLPNGVK